MDIELIEDIFGKPCMFNEIMKVLFLLKKLILLEPNGRLRLRNLHVLITQDPDLQHKLMLFFLLGGGGLSLPLAYHGASGWCDILPSSRHTITLTFMGLLRTQEISVAFLY